MKEMLEALVKSLVDFPDKISVTEVPGEKYTTLELRVDPSDMGKIIGIISTGIMPFPQKKLIISVMENLLFVQMVQRQKME